MPCSVVSVAGSIVTVKFEITSPFTLPNVAVPLFGPEYIRYPIQPGCAGVVFPADARLGGVSGLGIGIADLSTPANLSALVFFPIGNAGWTPSEDPNALLLYGPDGVIIRDKSSHTKIVLTPTGVTITVPAGQAVTINGNLIVTGVTTLNGALQLGGALEAVAGSTYTGDLKTTGNVVAGVGSGDQVGLKTHTHSGVTTGGGSTTPPTPGT